MAKSKTMEEKEKSKAGESDAIETKCISIDEQGGRVVFETNAADGTKFNAMIDQEQVEATADKGQIWFYLNRSLSAEPIVRLL
ncbi:hypothetical protein GCM10028808_73260 [Spirosoma migulaei]